MSGKRKKGGGNACNQKKRKIKNKKILRTPDGKIVPYFLFFSLFDFFLPLLEGSGVFELDMLHWAGAAALLGSWETVPGVHPMPGTRGRKCIRLR